MEEGTEGINGNGKNEINLKNNLLRGILHVPKKVIVLFQLY